MVKRIARGLIRRTQLWLREEPPPPDLTRYTMGEHAYDWLGVAFATLVRDPECVGKPAYVWGMLQGVAEARMLGIPTVTAIEFGVAQGRGLVSLEQIANKTSEITGVTVRVVGFDTGTGLTEPIDHRDVPNLLWAGRFPMDVEALRRRLKTSSLILGRIRETLPAFVHGHPPPVAFVSVDVDLYSATVDCLRLFDADSSILLPRVYCYFDDIFGYTYTDCNGEMLAIAEFNACHPRRQICKIHGLKFFVPRRYRDEMWPEALYIAHAFDHDLYGRRSSIATPEHDRVITAL